MVGWLWRACLTIELKTPTLPTNFLCRVEIVQSKPISTMPCFRRSLLNPRCPDSIHPSLNDMYVPVTSLPPPKDEKF